MEVLGSLCLVALIAFPLATFIWFIVTVSRAPYGEERDRIGFRRSSKR